jgi:hypothetical protein
MTTRRSREHDGRVVDAAMHALTSIEMEAGGRSLPDPAFIWWKAQLLRRLDAEQEALAPIDVGDRVHFGVAVAGAVLLAALAWNQLHPMATVPAATLGLAGAVAMLLLAVGVTAWRALVER